VDAPPPGEADFNGQGQHAENEVNDDLPF